MNNLIPSTFFEAKGTGEDAFYVHAGSFHMALYKAGIADYNISYYTSVLPKGYQLIERPDIPIGSELKTIMARVDSDKTEAFVYMQAGIAYASLLDPKTGETMGGIVSEYTLKENLPLILPPNETYEYLMYLSQSKFKVNLIGSIKNIYENTYKDRYGINYDNIKLVMEQYKKFSSNHATSIAALCFTDYYTPDGIIK